MIARFQALAPDFPPGEYENTFTNARGEVRTIYWRAAPVKDAEGRVVSIVSGGLDITERRKRELELERERDATTTALEAIPSIAVVLDREGTIRDRDLDNPRVGANRAFRQALGWRDHELVGLPFVDLIAEDDDGRASAAIATAAARWSIRGGRVGAPQRRRDIAYVRLDGGSRRRRHRAKRVARARLGHRSHRAAPARGREGARASVPERDREQRSEPPVSHRTRRTAHARRGEHRLRAHARIRAVTDRRSGVLGGVRRPGRG